MPIHFTPEEMHARKGRAAAPIAGAGLDFGQHAVGDLVAGNQLFAKPAELAYSSPEESEQSGQVIVKVKERREDEEENAEFDEQG